MRTEEQQEASPINIIQAKVERSLLCVAIGQVTLNLTVTINRQPVSERHWRRYFPKVLALAVASCMVWPSFAMGPWWGVERLKSDGAWSQVFRHSTAAMARSQTGIFCDPEMATRMKWSPPTTVRVSFFQESGMPEPSVAVINCATVNRNQALLNDLIPDPKKAPPRIKETVNLWD